MTKEQAEKTGTLWIKCPSCDAIIYRKDINSNFKICPKCGYYLRMTPSERIAMLADPGTEEGQILFTELFASLVPQDPLEFDHRESAPHKPSYLAKLASEAKKTGRPDAVVCGEALIGKHKVILAVMDFDFMGGSMGSVVGEKVTRAMEKSLELRVPLIIVSASGGARMQEGILSLMQMAKTSAALALLNEEKILVISLLCDPTTGGVTASYSMLGDVLIAEPRALIAFAGPRVIEQTIKEKLPEGFQQSEFCLKHGIIDCVVERKDLKQRIVKFLDFFSGAPAK